MPYIEEIASNINEAFDNGESQFGFGLLRETRQVFACRRGLLSKKATLALRLIETACPVQIAPAVLSGMLANHS